MDSFIKIKYDIASKKVKLSWNDIFYGINKGFISSDSAIEHATRIVSEDKDYSQAILDLATLYKGESVEPYLGELVKLEPKYTESEVSEKWLYLLLDWVFENKDTFSDPLGIVEQIYSDFDYPQLIATFVRYMPSEEPSLGSLELNEARLYKKWKDYLNVQKTRFSVGDV